MCYAEFGSFNIREGPEPRHLRICKEFKQEINHALVFDILQTFLNTGELPQTEGW